MRGPTDGEESDDRAAASVRRLAHARLEIALHRLSSAAEAGNDFPPLLLLHALGASAAAWRADPPTWPGPVHALDFAGHGASDPVRGGGSSPEYFLGDADRALAALGDRAVVAGRGVGAYVALLLAGARADRVPAALLLPGAGIAGDASVPGTERWSVVTLESWERRIVADSAAYARGTDPMTSLADHEHRPDDYVADFAAAARCLLLVGAPDPVPSWWQVAGSAPNARSLVDDPVAAFTALARAAR